MSRVLPILFNTEMVRAIQRKLHPKTTTRRCIKGYIPKDARWGYTMFTPKGYISCRGTFSGEYGEKFFKLPYQKGDILYVRETWNFVYNLDDNGQIVEDTGRYVYYADDSMPFLYWTNPDTGERKDKMPWKPSIHMPKDAARIWIRVTDVQVERLKEITKEKIKSEGIYDDGTHPTDKKVKIRPEIAHLCGEWTDEAYKERFAMIWDSTIKKSDLARYGWLANPWVWVIEFERCEKPEEGKK